MAHQSFSVYVTLWGLLLVMSLGYHLHGLDADNERLREKKANLVQNLKKLKKLEGAVKLVGGRGEFEGNVEVLHNGQWGAVCDDEWDKTEATVICRQLGYVGAEKHTHSGAFGPAKRRFWMDNIYCDGTEDEITRCRFDGWGLNDCGADEAAGVICSVPEEIIPVHVESPRIPKVLLPKKLSVRLAGGRVRDEGRVEVQYGNDPWQVVCGDGFSLLEGNIVCKMLGLGYASEATQTDFFGGNANKSKISGIECKGNEQTLSECYHDETPFCPGNGGNIASVFCTDKMSDLVIDFQELTRTAHLEDKQMFFLQCAMEENCLASQAYKIQQESDNWHLDTRRLLKFTARILNAGTADFRPSIPKHLWEWHMCHMHYHSMEVFATFDVYDLKGNRVAEGHKASFCLEDNQCLPGVEPRYACANYGDQGISVNCSDIYKYTVDCQWVDISELDPGMYTLKVAVNPEFKIPEISFDNNAAVCDLYYSETHAAVTNCVNTRP